MKTKLMATRNKTSTNATGSSAVTKKGLCAKLVKQLGGGYSSALGIDLAGIKPDEVFKWFLASILFGARIGEGVAIKAYKEFEKAGMLSPDAILETGWQGLVDILDRGGYVRYDFKTSTKILEVTRALKDRYKGDLNRLHFFAEDEKDLEKKLQNLGKGIGPVTVNIFLREMRGLWEKAEPPLAEPALLASRNIGLTKAMDMRAVLEELETVWRAHEANELRFSDLEAVLIRLGKDYCQKKRCSLCLVKEKCLQVK